MPMVLGAGVHGCELDVQKTRSYILPFHLEGVINTVSATKEIQLCMHAYTVQNE